MKLFQDKIEWYDIKTKGKKILRSLVYSGLVQELIASLIFAYMWLVYLSSKKKFINPQGYLGVVNQGGPLIFTSWHNRLMMMPFITIFAAKKCNKPYRIATLTSRHGDGQFVGKVMRKFGAINIHGSSNQGRSKAGRVSGRGIDLSTVRELIRILKNGNGVGITPDGPRGPNQKVNGEVINLAKISGAPIITVSYSSSRFLQFNSWDKFKLPLPFSKICFCFGDFIFVDKGASQEQEASLRLQLEAELNFVQEKSVRELRQF